MVREDGEYTTVFTAVQKNVFGPGRAVGTLEGMGMFLNETMIEVLHQISLVTRGNSDYSTMQLT